MRWRNKLFINIFSPAGTSTGNPKYRKRLPEALVDAAIRRSYYRDHPVPGKRKNKEFFATKPLNRIGYEMRGPRRASPRS